MVEKDDDGEDMVYVASWEVLKFQNKQEFQRDDRQILSMYCRPAKPRSIRLHRELTISTSISGKKAYLGSCYKELMTMLPGTR